MTGYILVSVMTGLLGGGYGIIIHGSGIGPVIGWYLVGGWIGLALMILLAVMLGSMGRPGHTGMFPTH